MTGLIQVVLAILKFTGITGGILVWAILIGFSIKDRLEL